ARDIHNTLQGKVADFISVDEDVAAEVAGAPQQGMQTDAIEILTQLGHSAADARVLVQAAFDRRPDITTADELITEALAERA
ncbi:MAG TPA: hypothetical protein QGH10_03840, partial [Armatimonadota bacterium]|nr:hypothetical protein [Armatimonadota bacterium]